MDHLISIILPVKNEPYLPQLIDKLTYAVHGDVETLVQTEKGLGNAVKCGLSKAKGDIVVIMDSDGSHPAFVIPWMIDLLSDSDIVIGSRYVKGGLTEDSFSRRIISKVFCKFAKALFGLSVKDNMSGFIVAKKSVFQQYPINNSGFKFVLELLIKSKGKLKAVEYPITFSQRQMGKSKANYKEAFKTLFLMIKLKANFKL